MHTEELSKVLDNMRLKQIDFALVCSPENVVYLSGFDTPPVEGAGNDQAGGYPLSYVFVDAREGKSILLVPDFYEAQAKKQSLADEIQYFTLFGHLREVDRITGLTGKIEKILEKMGSGAQGAVLGIEQSCLPVLLAEHIKDLFPDMRAKEIAGLMNEARMIKTPRELELIRNAVRVNDAGMREFLSCSKESGQNELEVWNRVVSALTLAYGEPVPVFGEIITGVREEPLGFLSGPVSRKIQSGDIGMIDLSNRCNGYWADCSNTVVFGGAPSALQQECAAIVKEAYAAVLREMRPGMRCGEIDAIARDSIESKGRELTVYTGHAIGSNLNEHPRILQYDHTVLKENMVFCLEPQIYTGKLGNVCYRYEKMVLVTSGGAQELSDFDWGI